MYRVLEKPPRGSEFNTFLSKNRLRERNSRSSTIYNWKTSFYQLFGLYRSKQADLEIKKKNLIFESDSVFWAPCIA